MINAVVTLYILSPFILIGLLVFVLVLYLRARSRIEMLESIIENPGAPNNQKAESMQQLEQNPDELVVIQGNGDFDVAVVGTSRRQRELAKIVGPKAEDSFNLELKATLEFDNSNPHDTNAIRVLISGQHVGYLSRDNAIEYRINMHKLGQSGKAATCDCLIVGGWTFIDEQGNKDEGSYGVRLDLPWAGL